VHHLSLKENAYHIIKDKLLSMEYECGSRLREDLLAEEISMSRTPVREAIQQLTAEGYIINVPRKGIFVVSLTPKEILNLLEIRMTLERLAVEKCIKNLTAGDFEMLTKIHQRYKKALENDQFTECIELDGVFHQKIALIADNPKLYKFIKEIEEFMLIARAMEKKIDPRKKHAQTLSEHEAILTAIEKQDVDLAKEMISRNITAIKHSLHLDEDTSE
jgi:GntR family transcriptional regulator, rspAB operon transcriptional repressor